MTDCSSPVSKSIAPQGALQIPLKDSDNDAVQVIYAATSDGTIKQNWQYQCWAGDNAPATIVTQFVPLQLACTHYSARKPK